MEIGMRRRTFLSGLAASAAAIGANATPAAGEGWRRFELTTTVELAATDTPAQLWLPMAGNAGAYQRGLGRRFETSGRARIVRDARYHEPVLAVRWDRAGGPRTVTVTETLATRDRASGDGAMLTAEEQRFWTAPVASLPTDGIVGATAAKITSGLAEPKARLRAIYDWVVDNTFRDAATRGCGIGGIESMLRTGFMGGKCADINSLMVGLCRAAGIPARDAYGIRVGPSRIIKQLGASGDVTHAQHCRAEMWLAGEGWFPVDPADVRKVVLEAKLPVTSPEVRAQRERLFGSWEMNWVAYNHATDIALPGAPRPMAEHFLMYPCAMTPAGEVDQLSPDAFRYRMSARELA
jgi:transglutaminase-like putative cysteine protease